MGLSVTLDNEELIEYKEKKFVLFEKLVNERLERWGYTLCGYKSDTNDDTSTNHCYGHGNPSYLIRVLEEKLEDEFIDYIINNIIFLNKAPEKYKPYLSVSLPFSNLDTAFISLEEQIVLVFGGAIGDIRVSGVREGSYRLNFCKLKSL